MTREEIIRMAQECHHPYSEWNIDIERFAALVAAAEREACAYKAGIALLGADRGLTKRVDKAIRERTKP